MASFYLFGFLFLACYFLLLHSAAGDVGRSVRDFDGWDLKGIRFPFTTDNSSECGLPIRGGYNRSADKEVQLGSQWCKFESIFQIENQNSIFIKDPSNTTKVWKPPADMSFHSLNIVKNISFFICNRSLGHYPNPGSKFKYAPCHDYDIYYSWGIRSPISDEKFPYIFPNACSVEPQVGQPCIYSCTFLISLLEIEIESPKTCEECHHPRKCQCLPEKGRFQCEEPPPPPPPPPVNHKGRDWKLKIIDHKGRDWKLKTIGLSIGLAGMTIMFVILLLYKRRNNSSSYQKQPRTNSYSVPYTDNTIKSGTVYFGIPVFSHEELQEATNNFDQARELGEGGFGIVYYGKLQDGREVAVKRLYKCNYRLVETFINEIQILTRLRHTNLVTLYGCTSRHSRELLLVYEYIPNGTISCHLHGDKAKPGSLPWPVRMKIAIETASALAYLHASDIIHRDVKTSNILLDNNFCVKVADFGLSKLFPNDATHVSTAPKGTPGYVDPDYRICYQLTSKSDVYSFGVVLVELISSMPAVDVTRDRGEVNLANLATRKILKGAICELVDPSLGFYSDDKIQRMIIAVAELAFRCLQGDKELRPSMAEVLEVLHRIESGRDEPWNLEGIHIHGAGISNSYAHPSLRKTTMKPQHLHQTN